MGPCYFPKWVGGAGRNLEGRFYVLPASLLGGCSNKGCHFLAKDVRDDKRLWARLLGQEPSVTQTSVLVALTLLETSSLLLELSTERQPSSTDRGAASHLQSNPLPPVLNPPPPTFSSSVKIYIHIYILHIYIHMHIGSIQY